MDTPCLRRIRLVIGAIHLIQGVCELIFTEGAVETTKFVGHVFWGFLPCHTLGGDSASIIPGLKSDYLRMVLGT